MGKNKTKQKDGGEIGITAHIPSLTEIENFATFRRECTVFKLQHKKTKQNKNKEKKKTHTQTCALFFSPSQRKTCKSREVVFLEICWYKFLHPSIKTAL